MQTGLNFRTLYILRGAPSWTRPAAQHLVRSFHSALWIGENWSSDIECLPSSKAVQLLGRECDCVVYDGWTGMDPDALGIVSGLVTGGGLFVLLLPDNQALGEFVDPQNERIAVYPYAPDQISHRWLTRFSSRIDNAQEQRIAQTVNSKTVFDALEFPLPAKTSAIVDELRLTEAQQQVVDAIFRLSKQTAPGVILLTADRGRGKSTALGKAIAKVSGRGMRALATAPSRDRAAAVFRSLEGAAASCDFYSPDQLLQRKSATDLLVVDEAASLPGQVLLRLMERFPKIVFAATLHGYEGSGRGFALRFQTLLDESQVHCRRFTLREAVRWPEADPVELFFNDVLMLDAEIVEEPVPTNDTKLRNIVFNECDKDDLARNNARLRAVFGLLVEAHYQTRPMDLRHLLDGPNLSAFVATNQNTPVGVLLAAREGGLDEAMVTEIQYGRRRPHGHLMPQTLAFSGALQSADGALTGLRIVRIAVHPRWQRRGIGCLMARALEQWAKERDIDYIGASFGLTLGLFNFWRQADYFPVHLGLTHNKASALRSVLVVKPLNDHTAEVLDVERCYFSEAFGVLRSTFFPDVDKDFASSLVAAVTSDSYAENMEQRHKRYRELCNAVAFGHRGIDMSIVPLRYVLASLPESCLAALDHRNVNFIFGRVFELRGWPELEAEFGFAGRREADRYFRQSLRTLLDCAGSA